MVHVIALSEKKKSRDKKAGGEMKTLLQMKMYWFSYEFHIKLDHNREKEQSAKKWQKKFNSSFVPNSYAWTGKGRQEFLKGTRTPITYKKKAGNKSFCKICQIVLNGIRKAYLSTYL